MKKALLTIIVFCGVGATVVQGMPFAHSALFATLAVRRMQLQEQKAELEADLREIDETRQKIMQSKAELEAMEQKRVSENISLDGDEYALESIKTQKQVIEVLLFLLNDKEAELKMKLQEVERELGKL